MKTRLSPRAYVVLAFAAFSVVITLVMAVTTLVIMEVSEDKLTDNTIMQEAQMLSAYYLRHPDAPPIAGEYFKLYITGPDKDADLPAELAHMAGTKDEIRIGDNEYIAIQVDKAPFRFYFLYDVSDFETFELSIDVAIVVFLLIALTFALWIGIYASGKVIAPVQALANRLGQEGNEYGLVEIPGDMVNDEIGRLTNKFLEYNERIKGYIEREKAFTSNASHELRTPVSVIAGAVELLEDSDDLSEADRRALLRIKHEVNVMRELINVLTALSRGEDQSKAHEAINVNSLIKENMDRLAQQAADKQIALNYVENAQLVIDGNRQALDIVLRNLLANAIQYTGQGTVSITVNNRSVSIEDSGPGISGDIQDKVFERFFRGHKETAKSGSLGVGLALVKQLCEANHWIINLKTGSSGKGTRADLHF